MLKTVSVIMFGLFVSGCALTPQTSALKKTAKEVTTVIANDAFDDAIWFICKAAPVGIIMKKLDVKKKQAWTILCAEDTELF